MEADATFRDMVERAENVAEARATTLVVESAYKGNWTAAAWWLERRRPDQYGRRMAIDVSVRDEAQRIADELGVNADDVIAEAERILADRR